MPRLKTGSAFGLVLLIALMLVAAACGGGEEGAAFMRSGSPHPARGLPCGES